MTHNVVHITIEDDLLLLAQSASIYFVLPQRRSRKGDTVKASAGKKGEGREVGKQAEGNGGWGRDSTGLALHARLDQLE